MNAPNQSPDRERESGALVRALLQTAVDGILTIDARGIVETMNPAAERIFGYRKDEVVGRNISLLMPEPDRGRHDGYIRSYLQSGERKIIGIGREVLGRRKDGTRFPMELAVSEVGEGTDRRFAGFVRDVTARRRAEEELRQRTDFAERLIDTAHAIVLLLDLDGRIVRFNRFMEDLCGYRLEEVRGKSWFETFIPARDHARIRDVFAAAKGGTPTRGNENPIVTKGGGERVIAWWDDVLKDPDGAVTGLLCIGHDITELTEARERAVQAERLAGIGEMIAGLAHESRNALQRIQACLEMLSLEVEDNERAQGYVDRIQSAQDYLRGLYDEVRGYASPIVLELTDCDLRRLWRSVWADLELVRRDKGVRLEESEDDTDLECRVDAFALGRVLRNIFENAIAACADGGRIRVSGKALKGAGAPAVRISIEDEGPGLSEEAREKVFRPFYTTKTKGTGLGLAIVRRLVEAHQGSIDLGTSRYGGAAFVVTLPRRPVGEGSA